MIIRWLDRIALCGVALLILFTPLAVGSVEPWGYSLAEVAVFFLMISLGMRILCGQTVLSESSKIVGLVAPMVLFIALGAFQLIPLPPKLERVISHSTYRLYSTSLPGWPSRNPYSEPRTGTFTPPDIAVTVILPSVEQVQSGFAIPYAPGRRSRPTADRVTTPSIRTIAAGPSMHSKTPAASSLKAADWRPISITPSLTKTPLLKFIAYTCLFVIILLYPFGTPHNEASEYIFDRTLVSAVLIAGLVAGSVGLLEHICPNGRVLWVFTPYSWQDGNPWSARVSGTFANPDHFANYLNLVLPLALAGAFFPDSVARKRPSEFRLLCAITTLIVLCALILSASRAGWIGALIALAIMISGAVSMPLRPPWLGGRKTTWILLSVITASAIATALFWIGPAGRAQADLRVAEAVSDQTIATRLIPALDSLHMVRAFPLFGVGLGCWPEIFPHFQRPPWTPLFWNAAHNDYVQLAAEAGLPGLGLLVWFFVLVGKRMYHGLKIMPANLRPLSLAVVAATGMTAFHEFVDFPLQIPANALLFTILLALGLRIGRVTQPHEGCTMQATAINYVIAGAISLSSLALIIVATRQDRIPYPYNVQQPNSVFEARRLILEYPANSDAHLAMVEIAGTRMSPADRLREYAIATWLEPASPVANDSYAFELLEQKETPRALERVTHSVLLSPAVDTHFYLSRAVLNRLPVSEQSAIESGYKMAVARGYQGALDGLGNFYDSLHKFDSEGALYADAAADQHDPTKKTRYLIVAGLSYARVGGWDKSIAKFREAAALRPSDPAPYAYLATRVFGPAENTSAINAEIAQGISHGADPFMLFLAAAEADETAGDRKGAEAQLRRAVTMKPANFDAVELLGQLYMREGRYAMAAVWLRKAVILNPSADAFYNLAVGEEEAYDYFAANDAYAKALAMAPEDPSLRSAYQTFQRKLASNDRPAKAPQ